jgi:hypothetical protein
MMTVTLLGRAVETEETATLLKKVIPLIHVAFSDTRQSGVVQSVASRTFEYGPRVMSGTKNYHVSVYKRLVLQL